MKIMSHKMLRPFIVKVSVLCYFPLYPLRFGDTRVVEVLTLMQVLPTVHYSRGDIRNGVPQYLSDRVGIRSTTRLCHVS